MELTTDGSETPAMAAEEQTQRELCWRHLCTEGSAGFLNNSWRFLNLLLRFRMCRHGWEIQSTLQKELRATGTRELQCLFF